MPAVEVWGTRGLDRVISLDDRAYTLGSDPASADISLPDTTVSGVHTILERVGATWLVRDVGSRNGTRLNGERLTSQRRLRDRDEIGLGRPRLVFLDARDGARPRTQALEAAPANLTRMERRVLAELCRPLVSHNSFQQPASVREIASRLFVGKNAVQAHLTNLYGKFAIAEGAHVNRRLALANDAIQRGAVTMADLEEGRPGEADGRV